MNPSVPEDEVSKGRIALWLSPEQIAFIANEWRKIPNSASLEVRERWGAIAFRAMAALHKAGVAYEPLFPEAGEAYQLTDQSNL